MQLYTEGLKKVCNVASLERGNLGTRTGRSVLGFLYIASAEIMQSDRHLELRCQKQATQAQNRQEMAR